MRHLFRFLFCVLFSISIWAEETDPPQVQEEIGVETEETVRILFSIYFSYTPGIMTKDTKVQGIPTLVYRSPTGFRSIQLYRNRSSEFYPYEGTLPIQFFAQHPDRVSPNAEQATEPEFPVLEASFETRHDRVLIAVNSGNQDEEGRMQPSVISYAAEDLSPENIRIYNGTPTMLGLVFRDQPEREIPLPANGYQDLTPGEFTDSTYPRVHLLTNPPGEKRKMLYTGKLYLKENTTNIFMIAPQGKRRLRILNIGRHERVDTDSLFPEKETTTEEE